MYVGKGVKIMFIRLTTKQTCTTGKYTIIDFSVHTDICNSKTTEASYHRIYYVHTKCTVKYCHTLYNYNSNSPKCIPMACTQQKTNY